MKRFIQILLLSIVFFAGTSGKENEAFQYACDNISEDQALVDIHYLDTCSDDYAFSTSETQCRVPRQSGYSSSTRSISNTRRPNTTHMPKTGFILTKSGKSMNSHTTSLFLNSISRFPSGMTETDHHFIGLGKLII